MGKGFNNYMTKKFFHPASKDNIKRVWMAKQKTEFEKKKQEDLMAQYQREQEMLSNRALLGDEKAKMGLSFLYDPPPGMKNLEKEDDEPEYKFEWQRKYNAPREAYAKGDDTISDQPFGIEVRNIRCIKCRQWGHVNTDKICPLFGKNLTAEPPKPETSTTSLLDSLREDGFQLKESMLGRFMASSSGDKEIVLPDEDENDPEVQFLKSLTPKQRKKLLKKMNKKLHGKGKKDKKKKKDKKRKSYDTDDSSSDGGHKRKSSTRADSSDSDEDERHKKQGARPKKMTREDSEARGRNSRHDSDSDHQKKKSREHKPALKREKSSRSPRPGSSKKRRESSSDSSDSSPQRNGKGERSHKHGSHHQRRGNSTDSDSSDHSPKQRQRDTDRKKDRSRSDGHSFEKSRRDERRGRRSQSPSPRRDRDRSSSRDRRGKHVSRKNRDTR